MPQSPVTGGLSSVFCHVVSTRTCWSFVAVACSQQQRRQQQEQQEMLDLRGGLLTIVLAFSASREPVALWGSLCAVHVIEAH